MTKDIKIRYLHMNVTSSIAHYFNDYYVTLLQILLSYIFYRIIM